MLEKELETIKNNLTKCILLPVGALAILEILWNLLGAYGFAALPLWGIKLAIFAYAGFICTGGPTARYRDRDSDRDRGTGASIGTGRR
jgi:hypothetical protein